MDQALLNPVGMAAALPVVDTRGAEAIQVVARRTLRRPADARAAAVRILPRRALLVVRAAVASRTSLRRAQRHTSPVVRAAAVRISQVVLRHTSPPVRAVVPRISTSAAPEAERWLAVISPGLGLRMSAEGASAEGARRASQGRFRPRT